MVIFFLGKVFLVIDEFIIMSDVDCCGMKVKSRKVNKNVTTVELNIEVRVVDTQISKVINQSGTDHTSYQTPLLELSVDR